MSEYQKSYSKPVFSFFGGPDEKMIMQTHLPTSVGLDLLKDAEENNYNFVKNDLHSSNLLSTEMSSWAIHEEKWAAPYMSRLMSFLQEGFNPLVCNERSYFLTLFDSWLVKYSEDSTLLPHHHGDHFSEWSFCWYLDVPDEGTEIIFRIEDKAVMKAVYSGDILVFPSGLMHWTYDVHENRKILAGNFCLSVVPKNIQINFNPENQNV